MPVQNVCFFVVGSILCSAVVLVFGWLWFMLLHQDEAGFELGWVGLYGMLTLLLLTVFIRTCTKYCDCGPRVAPIV